MPYWLIAAGWLPDFDSGFFERMQDDIAHNRFSPEGMFLVLLFFGLFGLALVIGLSIKTKQIRRVQYTAADVIRNPVEVMALLQQGVSQRSKVRLSFHRDDKRSRSTDAVVVDLSPSGFVLELSSVRRLNRAWIGKLIDCDFRVKEKNTELFNFYHFVTEIQDIRMGADEILRLHAAIPHHLEASQKRASLRIDPPERLVPVFRAWLSQTVTAGEATEADYATWGQADFSIDAGALNKRGTLVDLSGGGMGLQTAFAVFGEAGHRLAVADDIYIRIDLAEPEEEGALSIYVLARVMSLREEENVAGRHRLGLRFVRRGLLEAPDQTRLRWESVGDEGIREVDDWVYNRQLDQYRQRGGY